MKICLTDATFSHELAKARAASYSANKYKEPDNKTGDDVWLHKTLFRDTITRSQPSVKLLAKRYGPFVIVQLIGKNSVKLYLPPNMRIHPVVHVEPTTPFRKQLVEIAKIIPHRPQPVPGEGDALLFVRQ